MSIRSKLSSLREYLTPINTESNFSTTGEISPDEFVKAGDYLVYKFPTWQWGSCPDKLKKSFLPPDKQYLITRHVPSYQRVSTYYGIDSTKDEDEEEEDEDGWVKSKPINNRDHVDRLKKDDQNQEQDIDDLIDDSVEDDIEDVEEDDDDFQQIDSNNEVRKYDLYITYSTSYRVPKLYLVGFNSNGIPLLPNQMFDDISNDYKDKTATIENLPITYNTTSISIHPCKHSSVMKVLMKHAKRKNSEPDIADLSLEDTGIRVDQYLIIFLKFIASVTPGIEYDYTMDAL
ncbi:E2-like enzyme [Cerrena zonata]|uniref:Autophagy-related protein 3 n=1 Tax=Cerrena zonata TaxID=2478898 RepID=A0AAW0FNY7_9APHY